MRLTELDPCFVKLVNSLGVSEEVDSIKDADGLWLSCPACFNKNKGHEGTHVVVCWQPHIDGSIVPKPGRWKFAGDNLENLSLIPKDKNSTASILLHRTCGAHFFITNGEIQFC